jgi:hypothetical protein
MLFWGCNKKNNSEDNCSQIQKCKILVSKTSYIVGDTILLKTNLIPPISLFSWGRGENSNQTWGDPTVTIYPCSKNDEGWYYLNVSYPDCASMNDSIYITVTNNPVAPACTTGENVAIFSSIPNINFTTTTWGLDPDYNTRVLHGETSASEQDLNIYFNPYWNTVEPEDGAYNIYNQLDYYNSDDKYAVYINSNYDDMLFQASPGKVYVTHENQKLKVTFCSTSLNGDDGSESFTTTVTGSITAP